MLLEEDLSPFGEEVDRDLFLKIDGFEEELLEGFREELFENDLFEDDDDDLRFFMFPSLFNL